MSWTNRFSAASVCSSATTARRSFTPLLDFGFRLPLYEPRVYLLEQLRVEDLLRRELLLDPVERVEKVDEVAHPLHDVRVHLHRVDVVRHDLARQITVELHLARDDVDGGVAVVVDGIGRLARGAQDRLERVRVLLEHL